MDETPTLEQLITEIFEAYEELYRDDEIAAVATAATINDLFYRAESDSRFELAS